MTADQLAKLTDAHVTTARRWIRDRATMPPVVQRALTWLRGDLGAVSKDWTGWQIGRDGLLYSPENVGYTPGSVRAGPMYAETVRGLRDQLEEARAALQASHERRERIEALADLQNSIAAAQAAAARLLNDLPLQERQDFHGMLDSTRQQFARAAQDMRLIRDDRAAGLLPRLPTK